MKNPLTGTRSSGYKGFSSFSGVFSLGKANSVLSSVENAVVLSQKYISQNPQWTFRGNNVNGLETAETQIPVAKHLLKVTDKQGRGLKRVLTQINGIIKRVKLET
ncbi:hypothetical protein XENOCAPTIV_005439 [Xenoophorus captivus]|uniref:Uncharacterized protein n=1 Tax=Xenoophorus captivus TaxID=1517983 RepID=A0ABV0Q8B4_9TELE